MKSQARKDADKAFKLIKKAKTANYWVKRIRVLAHQGKRSNWKYNPEFVQEIIDNNGEVPKS